MRRGGWWIVHLLLGRWAGVCHLIVWTWQCDDVSSSCIESIILNRIMHWVSRKMNQILDLHFLQLATLRVKLSHYLFLVDDWKSSFEYKEFIIEQHLAILFVRVYFIIRGIQGPYPTRTTPISCLVEVQRGDRSPIFAYSMYWIMLKHPHIIFKNKRHNKKLHRSRAYKINLTWGGYCDSKCTLGAVATVVSCRYGHKRRS